MSPVALDTVYVLLTGRLTISFGDEQIELGHLDSVFLPAGCVRAGRQLHRRAGQVCSSSGRKHDPDVCPHWLTYGSSA